MEKIRINEIVKRGVVCIVKYEGLTKVLGVEAPHKSEEATLNSTFNAQEINYLENDVGIGGTVDVVIKSDKPNPRGGFYVNITNVDMTSAVKGAGKVESSDFGKPLTNVQQTGTPQDVLRSVKDTSIIAQCLTKASIATMPVIVGVHTAVQMYKEAIKLLDE